MKKLILLFLPLLFVACVDKNFVYDSAVSLKGWQADSAISFEPQITDSTAQYRTGIMIRNAGNYAYQNLWLFVEVERPDGTTKSDTVEYFLADPFGKWLGKSSIGSIYTITYLYEDTTSLASGVHRYSIKQAMRQQCLENITDIGLRIEKCE